MRLKVVDPSEVVVDRAVTKVTADAVGGSFCMLPRHADVVAELTPGLLSYVTAGDRGEGSEEVFVAVDGGTLVKCGDEVLVATAAAVVGPELERLQTAIDQRFRSRDEEEERARAALARLEADVLQTTLRLDEGR